MLEVCAPGRSGTKIAASHQEEKVRECRSCRAAFDERFRYCPWCGAVQRLKVVEYFTAFPLTEADAQKGLRVSRYLSAPGHVRFSVWNVGEVEAAVSIDESEALRLAAFLRSTDRRAPRARIAERLRQSADALLETLR
jgi:hypothetical protein